MLNADRFVESKNSEMLIILLVGFFFFFGRFLILANVYTFCLFTFTIGEICTETELTIVTWVVRPHSNNNNQQNSTYNITPHIVTYAGRQENSNNNNNKNHCYANNTKLNCGRPKFLWQSDNFQNSQAHFTHLIRLRRIFRAKKTIWISICSNYLQWKSRQLCHAVEVLTSGGMRSSRQYKIKKNIQHITAAYTQHVRRKINQKKNTRSKKT